MNLIGRKSSSAHIAAHIDASDSSSTSTCPCFDEETNVAEIEPERDDEETEVAGIMPSPRDDDDEDLSNIDPALLAISGISNNSIYAPATQQHEEEVLPDRTLDNEVTATIQRLQILEAPVSEFDWRAILTA
ncbi:hypothetical protein LTR28_011192, partial [Elasticomyces elasticus]